MIRSQLPGIVVTLLILSINGCSSGPIPRWDGKIWAGDSQRQSIRRSQANEEIKASDPEFDKYLAISYSDFRSFYDTYVLGCKEWRPELNLMSADEALSRFQIAMKDLENAVKASEKK